MQRCWSLKCRPHRGRAVSAYDSPFTSDGTRVLRTRSGYAVQNPSPLQTTSTDFAVRLTLMTPAGKQRGITEPGTASTRSDSPTAYRQLADRPGHTRWRRRLLRLLPTRCSSTRIGRRVAAELRPPGRSCAVPEREKEAGGERCRRGRRCTICLRHRLTYLVFGRSCGTSTSRSPTTRPCLSTGTFNAKMSPKR